jgi:hypothetical protein
MKSTFQQKSLDYREEKPGGNPQFITDGWAILVKVNFFLLSWSWVAGLDFSDFRFLDFVLV